MFDFFTWLSEEIKQLFVWLVDSILSGVASMFEAIPAPDFLVNAGTLSLPPTVAFIADALQLSFGAAVIVSAYTLRFIIRRLPFIG